MILLESSHWRFWSEPALGAQWMAAQVRHGDRWHDVVPDCRPMDPSSTAANAAGQAPEAPLPAANFHMIPYSNRIRDGRFSFAGEQIQLDEAESHAIHGALRKLPWDVVSCDSTSLTCEFDSRTYGKINWPWPLSARIEQRVQDDVFSSTIEITNQGDSPMPVGTGWHPYFVRQVAGSAPTLTLPVTSVYPDDNGDCLPTGAATALPEALDFRQARALDPDQRIDNCFAGLSGACHIHWKSAGIELIMAASNQCNHLVLFNPAMPHFAIEPVTNANDAFNLQNRGIAAGMQQLLPSQTLSVSMELRLRLHC